MTRDVPAVVPESVPGTRRTLAGVGAALLLVAAVAVPVLLGPEPRPVVVNAEDVETVPPDADSRPLSTVEEGPLREAVTGATPTGVATVYTDTRELSVDIDGTERVLYVRTEDGPVRVALTIRAESE